MVWHGCRIYYAVAGLLSVVSYVFIAKGYHGLGCSFLYSTVYIALSGIEDAISTEIYKAEKRANRREEESET